MYRLWHIDNTQLVQYNRWSATAIMLCVSCGPDELLINKFVCDAAFTAQQLDWTANTLSHFLRLT